MAFRAFATFAFYSQIAKQGLEITAAFLDFAQMRLDLAQLRLNMRYDDLRPRQLLEWHREKRADFLQREAEALRPFDNADDLHRVDFVVAVAVGVTARGRQQPLGFIEAQPRCAHPGALRDFTDLHPLDLQSRLKV